jgi:hypothetical protein
MDRRTHLRAKSCKSDAPASDLQLFLEGFNVTTVANFTAKKAAEFSGIAGEFCCLSLHRSEISKDS